MIELEEREANIAQHLLLSFIPAALIGFVIHAVTYFPQTVPALTKMKHIHAVLVSC